MDGGGPGWHPEIERKFLLDRIPDAARAHEPVEIEQGWLAGGDRPLRLRSEMRVALVPWGIASARLGAPPRLACRTALR